MTSLRERFQLAIAVDKRPSTSAFIKHIKDRKRLKADRKAERELRRAERKAERERVALEISRARGRAMDALARARNRERSKRIRALLCDPDFEQVSAKSSVEGS